MLISKRHIGRGKCFQWDLGRTISDEGLWKKLWKLAVIPKVKGVLVVCFEGYAIILGYFATSAHPHGWEMCSMWCCGRNFTSCLDGL